MARILLALFIAAPLRADIYDRLDELTHHLRSGGVPRDGIPAMTNPQSVAPEDAHYLTDWDLVLGVVANGAARAYPHRLGWKHEVVNDQLGGQYISVTFCPLTSTGLVFDATAPDSAQIEFGVSGVVLNSNLVLYDRRDEKTLYPQMIYAAISGAHKGQRLQLLPVVETTWGSVARATSAHHGRPSGDRPRPLPRLYPRPVSTRFVRLLPLWRLSQQPSDDYFPADHRSA